MKSSSFLRFGAALFAALYAWAFLAPALAPLAKLRFSRELPSCSMSAESAPCQCPMHAAMGGQCCCKHGHDDTGAGPREDCAKLGSCSHQSPQAAASFPDLGPHDAARAWEPLLLFASAHRVTPVLPIIQSPSGPPEKIPI